jgi:hypothetical protein
LGENTLRNGKPVGESDTPVLGELNQTKNSKIPRRNQEIATKGSKGSPRVVLERGKEIRVKE